MRHKKIRNSFIASDFFLEDDLSIYKQIFQKYTEAIFYTTRGHVQPYLSAG
ncbi:hypothetical protein [Winogradskyella sp.]|uniref:hypothetical protein n=1 Tax=Winogradskyella sp. TaxID=1883156 RepID=UPI0035130415